MLEVLSLDCDSDAAEEIEAEETDTDVLDDEGPAETSGDVATLEDSAAELTAAVVVVVVVEVPEICGDCDDPSEGTVKTGGTPLDAG